MKALHIRNLPDDVHEALKQLAADIDILSNLKAG
ncbi:MAG: FitA-like ribbon-helix-helix domain-containing protein [Halothiobacillaceae bacterium]